MKRYSEVVLNGHPDKFCDLIADRIIRHAYMIDPEAYAQIEVSVWSDQLFLTGAVVTRSGFDADFRAIISEVGYEIGYTKQNHIDVDKYVINDHVCRIIEAPQKWTHFVNDQCIVTGYAGYDAKTNFLPPEHFAVWFFREQIVKELKEGSLKGHGPDGKLLIVMDENGAEWCIKTLLFTMQQKELYPFTDFTVESNKALQNTYNQLQKHDSRWIGDWQDINVMVNPNGPLLNGGSDGDNGQTGRKLAMDFYGPRIPLGGGALYGKDLSHIDRIGSYAARKFAVELVSRGSAEAQVTVCYAPGVNEPLNVCIQSSVKPPFPTYQFFNFGEMRQRIHPSNINYNLVKLGTFYNPDLWFNLAGDML
ncbi:MAG: hypothetical protein EOM06_09325 [Sphingobacteriia bacterium]|nr:hypothetical protein [Sphingobacteriia bacterium]